MPQLGGKSAKKTSSDSKRHFTVVMGNKEHGLYVSSTPSSAARKAVTKLCAANKSKKVEFHIREITQGSKKKTYGPYEGYIEKLKEPIELKGRVIKYKPIAKLSGKSGAKKGGMRGGEGNNFIVFLFEGGKNIKRFLEKRSVVYIVGNLTVYFRSKDTTINTNDIRSPQILFSNFSGKTSDKFPEDLFETHEFKDLVRQLQVLLNRWKQVDTKFSIFISKGDWQKDYTKSNATSDVKTYGALDDQELNLFEKNHNYGSLFTSM